MDKVYLNGSYMRLTEAKVSVLDRGFLFGDGVYEVIPAYGGKLFRLDEHIDRLNNSLSDIRLPFQRTVSEWNAIFNELLDGKEDQSIYLQITRGYSPKRDHGFPADLQPTVFAMCSKIQAFPEKNSGIKAITVEDTRWQLCNIKAITLLANILLRQQALDRGCAEAILIKNGYVLEGAASNLFTVIDGELITPPKGNEILPGITRDLILELAKENAIPYREDIIALEALHSANEIWVASSTREILPVVELDGLPVADGKVGPIWHKMDQLFQAYKKSWLAAK
jgi:D-alanine transaminase